jgi:hypothetical protein
MKELLLFLLILLFIRKFRIESFTNEKLRKKLQKVNNYCVKYLNVFTKCPKTHDYYMDHVSNL